VREALRARRRELYRLWVDAAARRGEVAALCDQAERIGVPVSELAGDQLAERLDPALRRSNPQGVMLEAGSLPMPGLSDLLASLPAGSGCLVALDGVEDPQNVGALIRVAEASGADGLIVSERRAAPLGAAVARASSGALEWLPVARVSNLPRALDQCRDREAWVVGADPHAGQSLFELPDRLLSGRLVGGLGAEGRGLREGVRKRVDHALSIPMRGRVESLNVSAAGAVILYELLRRRESALPRG
jgi:23S rRNA (guanosine2251-2'-O)-methyltransferase